MGMPEGYLDNEDSPFKPVVVQPIEPLPPKALFLPFLFLTTLLHRRMTAGDVQQRVLR